MKNKKDEKSEFKFLKSEDENLMDCVLDLNKAVNFWKNKYEDLLKEYRSLQRRNNLLEKKCSGI